MKQVPILLIFALAFFIGGISCAVVASESSQDHTSTTQTSTKPSFDNSREIVTVSGTNYSSSASTLSMGIIAAACFLCGSYLLVKHLERGKP